MDQSNINRHEKEEKVRDYLKIFLVFRPIIKLEFLFL